MDEKLVAVKINRDGSGCQGDGVGVDDLSKVAFLAGRGREKARAKVGFGKENAFGDIDIGLVDLDQKPAPVGNDAKAEVQRLRFAVDHAHAMGDPGGEKTGQHAKPGYQRRIMPGPQQPRGQKSSKKTNGSYQRPDLPCYRNGSCCDCERALNPATQKPSARICHGKIDAASINRKIPNAEN